jgi:hypothetical protein
MAGKTTTHEAAVLNVLRATTLTAPANVYVALFSANPTDAGGGTEISGNGYARQLCGFGAPAGTPRQIANAADILFPVQTPAAYATVTGIAIMDALTAGNMLYWADIVDKTFNIGDQAKFAAAALVVQED